MRASGCECSSPSARLPSCEPWLKVASEEVEEETAARMEVIQGEEEQMFAELADLLDAELEYFSKCKELLEELHASWPAG